MADNAVKIPFTEAAAPATPAAGKVVVYAKTDGLMYSKDDAGTETLLGGGDATAHIADAADAHDASAISVLDTAMNFTGTDVEAVLAELQDNIDAVGGGSFDPDIHLPWHISIVPMIWTPDATAGTWSIQSTTETDALFPFYRPGSAANSGAAPLWQATGAQNDASAWDVILAAGTWDAHFWVRKHSAAGIITLNQDGASQGTVDTYAAAGAAAKVSITGWTVATTGKKRMQILAATKNASSSAYFMSVFAIEFRRTA